MLVDCAEDAARIGCLKRSTNEELECLEVNIDRLNRECRISMHELSKCLLTPHLFLPMEILSVIMLATASIVLFCTILRCCCRQFCLIGAPSSPPSEINLDEQAELSDASDDEAHAQPTPTQRSTGGGGHATSTAAAAAQAPAARVHKAAAAQAAAPPREEDDEDALPAYQQVTH